MSENEITVKCSVCGKPQYLPYDAYEDIAKAINNNTDEETTPKELKEKLEFLCHDCTTPEEVQRRRDSSIPYAALAKSADYPGGD